MPETSPRAHQALRSILPLIPTASSGPLIFALTEGFPHKRESRKVQTTYLRNVLWCITYAPGIRDQMLHVAVERILQVDVEIQVGVEEMEEMEEGEDPSRCDATAAVTKDPSPLSHLDSESDGDEESDEDDEDETEAQRLRMGEKRDTLQKIRGLTLKLDALLMLIFEFFQEERKRISGTSSTPSDIETDQFTLILEIFDRLILRTFKSRYTQFLLFWAASAQPAEFPDIFLGHLISLVTGPIGGADAGSSRSRFSPDVTRIAAASYVGSFVARAKFMPGDGVRNVTGILLAWASQYVEQCERQSSIAIGPDQAKHAVFYAVIQAVMYIFCFRWRELRIEALEEKDEEDGEEEPKEPVGVLSSWYPVISPLPRVIMSRLNPLKMCSKPVVQQFAHLSRSTHLMYCYTIIERNKSIYIPRSSSSTPGGELYSFFPFDPCQLPKTGRWVKDLYNEWEADDDDDDSDDDDGDEEEEDEDEGDFLGPDDDEEGIRGGVGAMSLSPASDSFLVSGIRRSKGTQ
ncbi:RNA polymerase I-specific transcription initiation factor RRN3 [Piptocephalis cylindrospora]|uniref:RNA polymerase I-specific transcription initiation factor RRN3 n=1 Tax=Piptocephalis cylindrospora TaxID=1907219 RepID=A0A4P9Y7N6_9FUNG|nr:RNA polymerase I-specific transcription initiation factor RRN3 [Piptocephalis cylindrospora]|eukprot:RKP15025.1 RNA polymerase I-specific transcription initiation factor RRN3 [Piptocephalis cylindrospora]